MLFSYSLHFPKSLFTKVHKEKIPWPLVHDDVIKWKHDRRYWPFVRGIHRSPVNSPHKSQWRGALMFSLICAWINAWSKQSWGWWFETLSRPLWRHCNGWQWWERTGMVRCRLTSTCIGIPMMKMRLSHDRLFFITEMLIPGKTNLKLSTPHLFML